MLTDWEICVIANMAEALELEKTLEYKEFEVELLKNGKKIYKRT